MLNWFDSWRIMWLIGLLNRVFVVLKENLHFLLDIGLLFHFCFVKPDGELDEEASPMFIKIDKLLKPMSTEFLDNIGKPLKDLMKGVSIGA